MNVDFKLVGVKGCVMLMDLRSLALKSLETHCDSI